MNLVVDLFSGVGWGVACQQIGLREWGVDSDPDVARTREEIGLTTFLADLRCTAPSTQAGGMLIGSPPCPTFSVAGHGAGRARMAELCRMARHASMDELWQQIVHGDDSDLVLTPLLWALAGSYEHVVLEQVPPAKPIWEAYVDRLESLGYRAEAGILNAEQYGVPQTRKRAILVASRSHRGPLMPTPTHSKFYPRDRRRLDEGVLPWASMSDALGWGMNARPAMTVTGGTGTGGAEPFGSGARQGMSRELNEGSWVYMAGNQSNAAVREMNEPSPTIAMGHNAARHGFSRGGQFIRVTAQQAAVLQGFPADMRFIGSKGSVFRQIGNAVPVQMAKAILSNLEGAILNQSAN